MSKNKHCRTFRLKSYPSEIINGVQHIYPSAGAKVARIALGDMSYFLAHPDETTFLRQAVPGEFAGVNLPDGLRLEDIKFVLVKRLKDWRGQARVPLTAEQTKRLEDPDYWRRVSGE